MADKPPQQPNGNKDPKEKKEGMTSNENGESYPVLSLPRFFAMLELRMKMAIEAALKLDEETAKRNRKDPDSSKDKEPGPGSSSA